MICFMKLRSPELMLLSGMAGLRHPNGVIGVLVSTSCCALLPIPSHVGMLASLAFPTWEQRWPPAAPSLLPTSLASPIGSFS